MFGLWMMQIIVVETLMLAGQYDSASQLISKNTKLIIASGAKILFYMSYVIKF